MAEKLTDSLIKALPLPPSGNKVVYDAVVRGFGVRVTAAGARSFVLNYRINRRERRLTIGDFPDWGASAARKEATDLKRRIDRGEDPLAHRVALRRAPTVADLCERYEVEHLPKKRPISQRDDRAMIARDILPTFRHIKVADVTFSDVDALHRRISARAPVKANRVVSLLSKMFSLSIQWGLRTSNPAKGIQRNPEIKRERYLTKDELRRVNAALDNLSDQNVASAVRLLLLTGARTGEVLNAKWSDFDLDLGVWVKPGSTTKQKTLHRVPLSRSAVDILIEMKRTATSDFLVPGRSAGHRADLKDAWGAVRKAAEIPDVRKHDLRHSYASLLANDGTPLQIIGRLLGHSQVQTTARYAHLFDDVLRAATNSVGASALGKASNAPDKGFIVNFPTIPHGWFAPFASETSRTLPHAPPQADPPTPARSQEST